MVITHPVGISTGSFAIRPVADAVRAAVQLQLDTIEVSCLDPAELDEVPGALETLGEVSYRVALHAPGRGTGLDAADAVDQLGSYQLETVVHPDAYDELGAWQVLGELVLIEHMDSRKRHGRNVDELDEVFRELPDAQMCLDISHALDVGGPGTAVMLARRYRTRIRQLHVGCGAPDLPVELGHELTVEVAEVRQLLAWPVPTIYERRVAVDALDALDEQLRQLRCP